MHEHEHVCEFYLPPNTTMHLQCIILIKIVLHIMINNKNNLGSVIKKKINKITAKHNKDLGYLLRLLAGEQTCR